MDNTLDDDMLASIYENNIMLYSSGHKGLPILDDDGKAIKIDMKLKLEESVNKLAEIKGEAHARTFYANAIILNMMDNMIDEVVEEDGRECTQDRVYPS